jgi:hypothetical protein
MDVAILVIIIVIALGYFFRKRECVWHSVDGCPGHPVGSRAARMPTCARRRSSLD